MSAISSVTPQQIGKAFVIQYYRILHEHPELLHRFYSSTSTFMHEDPTKTVIGTDLIAKRIEELNFKHRSIQISQVDCHSTVNSSVVVQVCGEISSTPVTNSQSQPIMKRFIQTFVLTLAETSKQKYYVHNDLFHYQDTPSVLNVLEINRTTTTPPVTPKTCQKNQKSKQKKTTHRHSNNDYYDDSWYYGNENEGYLSTGYIDDQEIFIGNLSAQITERDIHELFRNYGSLLLVRIGNTGSQVGAANFAFVVCQSIDMAQAIIADRDKLLQSQKIHVEAKKRRPFPHTFRPTYPTAASPKSYQSTGHPTTYYYKSSRSPSTKVSTQ